MKILVTGAAGYIGGNEVRCPGLRSKLVPKIRAKPSLNTIK